MDPDSLRSIRFLRSPALGGSELAYIRAFKGAAAPDRRRLLEISLIDRADKTIVYHGAKQRIRTGTVGIRTPFEAAKLVRHHAPETRARMLAVDDEELGAALAELRLRTRDLPSLVQYVDDARLQAATRAVFAAVERKASKLEQQERLAACTLRALERLTHTHDERAGGATPSAKLARARELLHDRMNEDVGLDELAREVGVTKHYLVRAFERHFHAPPHRYLMQIRVERARVLLLRGNLATNVAHECGFYDQSHLNRWFQREVGLTPARYAAARSSER